MINFVNHIPRPLPFVDTVPQWLGPTLLLIGISSLILWASQSVVERFYSFKSDILQTLVLLSVVLGIVFTTIGGLSQAGYVDPFSIILIAAGRFVEGGAVIRGIRKIHYLITEQPFLRDSEEVSTQIGNLIHQQKLPPVVKRRWPKIRYMTIRAGIGLTAIVAYLIIIWVSGLANNTLYALVLTWSLAVFALAVLGLSWKLEYAEEEIPSSLIIGLLAASAGAQVYDYVNLGWDITGIVVGTVAFLAGIIFGAFAFFLS